jgi:hypothetical protein
MAAAEQAEICNWEDIVVNKPINCLIIIPKKSKHVAVYSAICGIKFDWSVCYFTWAL